jgi:calcium-translocating P-type ATPase
VIGEALAVLSSTPGRLRIALPACTSAGQALLAQRLVGLHGVRRVEIGAMTGNALILFDPGRTSCQTLLPEIESVLARVPPSPPPPVLPRILHLSRGRVRIAEPRLTRRALARAEAQVRSLPGVVALRPSRRTGNLLVTFDPSRTSAERIFAALRTAFFDPISAATAASSANGHSGGKQLRIPLPGLDRVPRLGRQVVDRLEQLGVRAWTKRLTGHLLVEYDEERVLAEELLAELAHVSLPELPGEDRPAHPLDPEPLVEGVVRTVGAVLGISVLTIRRLAAGQAAQRAGVFALAASFVNLMHGFPFIRRALERWLGPKRAGLAAHGLYIAIQALADFPLGLVVSLVEAVTFLDEVTARRAAWRRYEEGLDGASSPEFGHVIRLEAGMRVPLAATVIEGTGSATTQSGLPRTLTPGDLAPAGAVLSGGPFVLEIVGGPKFDALPRPTEPAPSRADHYVRLVAPLSLVFAGFNLLRSGSFVRAVEGMLLLNPRTVVIGQEAANLGTAARCLRAGLTVVSTRPHRIVRRPDVLILDGPRILASGLEVAGVYPAGDPGDWSASSEDAPHLIHLEAATILGLAADISLAAGSPWGNAYPPGLGVPARQGEFNGLWASATLGKVRYTLGPPEDLPVVPDWFLDQHLGGYLLELRMETEERSLGFVALRPRLAPGVAELVETCRRLGVAIEMLPAGFETSARAVASRTGVLLGPADSLVQAVRRRQGRGSLVAFVSDHANAAPAFEACDLAIALSSGRREFPARADLLAPDLRAVCDLLEATARRDLAVRDSVLLGVGANVAGTALGIPLTLGPEGAATSVYLAALGALGASWLRLRGGRRHGSTLAHLNDPRPERWARWSIDEVLRAMDTSNEGLTTDEAQSRRAPGRGTGDRDELLNALRNQLRAPITGVMSAGACLTTLLGQPLNTALLGVTISLNVAIGVWEERQVGHASQALRELSAATARVLRDGAATIVAAEDVVPGDILVLVPGQRVAGDARLITASSLEVAEAALTGESMTVLKGPDEQNDSARIVLEGSDVIAGTGRAIVVAVGRQTRLGTTAAALNIDADEESPLGARLGEILKLALPVAAAGGVLTGLAGLVWGGTPMTMLTLGVTTALSAIPEGLPLLAGVGQAAVARRLSRRNALVRRVAAIEALGRIDVACTDKTGTLTEGRLAVCLLECADGEPGESATGGFPVSLVADAPGSPGARRDLLLTAALACPHPDAEGAGVHMTDSAILRAAVAASLSAELRERRLRELPFDSSRAFSASVFAGRSCIKGAPERLAPRCTHLGRSGARLDAISRTAMLDRVAQLAARGLRVLMVAEGPADTNPDDPHRLTVLGFIGISDPLRATVPGAVERCLLAGVRVLMLTGDHPSTARAIAEQAGLLVPGHDRVLRAADIADLSEDELDRALEGVAAVARATPLDKLRVIESLQRRQRSVAMTGDGVNDAPALRLADVGVAMGRSGTEVARQAADLVLIDDDFSTLVEALVEGRGFWRNMRKGLSLLLGGNAGELSLIAGASVLGYGAPLTPVHILIVNMITDALPSLAVLLQRPEHRNLAGLAREGLSALDAVLMRDVFRRGVATGIPSLAAFLAAHAIAGPIQGSAVGFTSIIATQLAQTLEAGQVEGALSQSVVGAVTASSALLLGILLLPPPRNFLGLVSPGLVGWGLVAASSVAAVALSRLIEHGWQAERDVPDWAKDLREALMRQLEQRRRLELGGVSL